MNARDQAYFLRRIFQEDEAAAGANCSEARERHEELAAAYRLRCRLDPLAREPKAGIARPEKAKVGYAA